MSSLLFIIALQLVYVPLLTLRTILVVKGSTQLAVPLGFAESLVHIIGISIILDGEKSLLQILVYCTGYAIGIYFGSSIEKKLAIGYQSVNILIQDSNRVLVDVLRDEGFGVTAFGATGRDGDKVRLDVVSRRSDIDKLRSLTLKHEPSAFISVFEIIDYNGGHIVKRMRRKKPS